MLDARKMDVLRAIVSDYVSSREPVGSRALVERHGLNVSPATVRNDMAALEEEGYITQPHTSAGRIPTDKGYRLFVDRLTEVKPLSGAEKRAIQSFLSRAVDLDDVVARTVRLLSQITHQVAIVRYPTVSAAVIRRVDIVPLTPGRVLLVLIVSTGHVEQRIVELPEADEETLIHLRDLIGDAVVGEGPAGAARRLAGLVDAGSEGVKGLAARCVASLMEMLAADPSHRVMVGGVTNVASFGADFVAHMRPVLEALEEQVVLLKLLDEAAEAGDLVVRIGQENPVEGLQSTSVVTSAYGDGTDAWASLGIVGPTRMDYPSTMAAVRAVARYVGRYLAEG